MALQRLTTAEMGRIPPALQHMVIRRAEWSLCVMEHSRIDAIRIEDPGAAFHHIGLPLGILPGRMGIEADGRRSVAERSPDSLGMIEAGVASASWWDEPYEAACFYFTSESLAVALGHEIGEHEHTIRTTASIPAPTVCRLLHALREDAARGQPHGVLVGDSIFVALAGLLAPAGVAWRGHARPGTADWRTGRALEYIHAHLTDSLDIQSIAAAAGSSPFHLSRQFRSAIGISMWQYVLQERARHAVVLMQHDRMSLLEVSHASGFETYPSFVAAIRHEFGVSPSSLRTAV